MADDKSTTVAEDTSVDEATTSTNEETQDTDTELEDIEVTPEEIAGDETEEEESKDETEDTEPGSEESEEDEATEEQSEEAELSEEDKQKAFNKEQAERRIQDKQQREATIQEAQQKYLEEADPEKPEDLALRQLQVSAYNNQVKTNTNELTNGYQKALNDFDILRDQSPEVQAELDDALDSFQARYVTLDGYGNPQEVKGDLYQFLQTKADSIRKLTGIGAIRQQNSKGKEKSKTFTPPSKAPKEPKVDPDLAAFDEEAKK